MCMQGFDSGPLGVALTILFAPVAVYMGVRRGVQAIPGAIERTNTKIYDVLHPDALHRKLVKYGAILSVKNDAYYSYKRGVVYFLLGKYQEAIKDFENCNEFFKGNLFEADYYRGMTLTRLARYTEAIEAYTAAYESFTETTDHESTVIDSLRQTKRNLSRFSHGVTSTLITKLHIRDTAHIVEKQKHREQVEDVVDQMFKVKIDKSDILNNRGLAHLNCGNYEESISDLESAGELRHHFVFNLGYAYYFMNDVPMAIKYFQRAIELAKDTAPAEYHIYLACSKERIGDTVAAEQIRAHVTEKAPEKEVRPFHIKRLPDNVIQHILSFSDHRDLCKVLRTCRAMNRLGNHSSLYTTHYNPDVNGNGVRDFYMYTMWLKDKTKVINTLDIVEPNYYSLDQTVRSEYFLCELKIKVLRVESHLSEQGLSFVFSTMPELEELKLIALEPYDDSKVNLSGAVYGKVINNLKKLEIDGPFNDFEELLKKCGANLIRLKTHSIDQSLIAKYCPQLESRNGVLWIKH